MQSRVLTHFVLFYRSDIVLSVVKLNTLYISILLGTALYSNGGSEIFTFVNMTLYHLSV